MTVAAAILIEGIPALIGDFLITDNDTTKPHDFLPTRPDINSKAFEHLKRRIAGTRRKIHIFNDRFIAGFTGSVDAGAEIFADLEQRFTMTAPTIRELDATLQQFNTKYAGSAEVTGWTMRTRPRCFRWSAGSGSGARLVPSEILGSGAVHFGELLARARMRGYSKSVTQAWDKAVLQGLTIIGDLVTEELSSGKNLEAAYGYGGEMILLTSRGFHSVEKFTLMFWDARIERDGTLMYRPREVAAVYENRGRYAAVQIAHLQSAEGQLKANSTHVMAITPIHDPMDDLDVTAMGRLELSAPYYFVAFFVVDTRSGKSGVFTVIDRSGPDSALRFIKKDGKDFFEMDMRAIAPRIKEQFREMA